MDLIHGFTPWVQSMDLIHGFGFNLGPTWDYVGVSVGSCLGSVWGQLKIILGSTWDHFGINLELVLELFEYNIKIKFGGSGGGESPPPNGKKIENPAGILRRGPFPAPVHVAPSDLFR